MAWGITTGAEYTHQGYEAGAAAAQEHPEIVDYSNVVVDAVGSAAGQAIDTNPNTATWSDLGAMWLFESSPNQSGIRFGPEATTTRDLMGQQGVQEMRSLALAKIAQGDLSQTEHQWVYGQDAYYNQ